MQKIKIYLDSGADITGIKKLYKQCLFVNAPYDDSSNRRKNTECALPPISQAQWRDANWTWEECNTPWEENTGSKHFTAIQKIIGKGNRRDALHLDSAYKEGVHCFLTADKKSIWTHRHSLEALLDFKIFHPPSELEDLRVFIGRYS